MTRQSPVYECWVQKSRSIDAINLCNVYWKYLTNASVILSTFIILINLTWNIEKALSSSWSETKHMIRRSQAIVCLAVTVCEWFVILDYERVINFIYVCICMNVADCCANELGFRICTNCKNIHFKVYKLLIINICYKLLFFHNKRLLIFITVFWNITHPWFTAGLIPLDL